jgi:hypothetical protein
VIDFAKTLSLPDGLTVTHRQPWQQGNHEEGWLTGIDNLIRVIKKKGTCHPQVAAVIEYANDFFFFFFFALPYYYYYWQFVCN